MQVLFSMDALALVKGNKIYLNGNARKYPKYILKYIMAHELAHLVVKRHTRKFWGIVKHIYPQYEKGRDGLLKRRVELSQHKNALFCLITEQEELE
jgi:predicted metal-dependent hydrolase